MKRTKLAFVTEALIERRRRDECRLLFIEVDWLRKGGRPSRVCWESRFLCLPSRADCTPVVLCKASAYGVPSHEEYRSRLNWTNSVQALIGHISHLAAGR